MLKGTQTRRVILDCAYIFKPHKFYPMNESKIQWEGWGEFKNMEDFLLLASSNIDGRFYRILWPTTDCPIVIWLN